MLTHMLTHILTLLCPLPSLLMNWGNCFLTLQPALRPHRTFLYLILKILQLRSCNLPWSAILMAAYPVACARYLPKWSNTSLGSHYRIWQTSWTFVSRRDGPPKRGNNLKWSPCTSKGGTGGTPTITGGWQWATPWPNSRWVPSTRGCRLWLMRGGWGPPPRQALGLGTPLRIWGWFFKLVSNKLMLKICL